MSSGSMSSLQAELAKKSGDVITLNNQVDALKTQLASAQNAAKTPLWDKIGTAATNSPLQVVMNSSSTLALQAELTKKTGDVIALNNQVDALKTQLANAQNASKVPTPLTQVNVVKDAEIATLKGKINELTTSLSQRDTVLSAMQTVPTTTATPGQTPGQTDVKKWIIPVVLVVGVGAMAMLGKQDA
jgi:polyhydroxyalkanoate synthesis regulator phasin